MPTIWEVFFQVFLELENKVALIPMVDPYHGNNKRDHIQLMQSQILTLRSKSGPSQCGSVS